MAGQPDRGNPWSGSGTAWSIIGTLLAGMLAWGGIGYLIDRLTGLQHVFLPIGILVGAGTGIYIVWVRYGRDQNHR